MKYSEFLKSVQARKIPPVITFLGEEIFLKQRALDAVKNCVLSDEEGALNYRTLYDEDLKDVSFLEDANTLPMFSEMKILYVKNAVSLEKSWGRVKDYLQQYLEKPSAQTILIFDIDYWEGRSKLKGVLAKKSAVVEFLPLSEREVPSWIQSHLKTLNFRIEPDAVQALIERRGTDLQKLSADLEKLMLLRQSEKVIGLEDVENMIGHSPLASIWNWSEAILDQNTEMAVAALNDLLERGEEPVYCVAVLTKQYEKMILTKEMVQQKIPSATISQKINKPVYYLQKYLQQLSRFTMADLVKAVEILALTDRALKTGQAQDGTILQLMTIQLCNLKSPAQPIFDVPLQ